MPGGPARFLLVISTAPRRWPAAALPAAAPDPPALSCPPARRTEHGSRDDRTRSYQHDIMTSCARRLSHPLQHQAKKSEAQHTADTKTGRGMRSGKKSAHHGRLLLNGVAVHWLQPRDGRVRRVHSPGIAVAHDVQRRFRLRHICRRSRRCCGRRMLVRRRCRRRIVCHRCGGIMRGRRSGFRLGNAVRRWQRRRGGAIKARGEVRHRVLQSRQLRADLLALHRTYMEC